MPRGDRRVSAGVKLVSITAGVSHPSGSRRLGDALAQSTVAALADRACSADVEQVELRLLAADLASALTRREVSPALQAAQEAIVAADGVIAVTPVYNGSYSGLFKLFFDALDPRSLIGRPTLLAATGGSQRHSLMVEHTMVPLFSFLKADISPLPVYATSADWNDPAELEFRIARAADAFAQRISQARPLKALPEPAVPSYDDLLHG